MLSNDNNYSFNSFKEMPKIPYQILTVLINNTDEDCEKLWKLIAYPDSDALSKPNLTREQKLNLIWKGESTEQHYNVFLKPMVSSSIDNDKSQTQLRLYRYNTMPLDRIEGIVCFEFDILVHADSCLVYDGQFLCEKTDLMEGLLLSIFNGRDIGVGSGVLEYNRELSRSCNSQLSISNSKTFYGRAVILALPYTSIDKGDTCG